MRKPAHPLQATGEYRSAWDWAWALLQDLPVLARVRLPDRWLKLLLAIREHVLVSNSHSSSDWPSLNRWFYLLSYCCSCVLSNSLWFHRKAFALAKAFSFWDGFIRIACELVSLSFHAQRSGPSVQQRQQAVSRLFQEPVGHCFA